MCALLITKSIEFIYENTGNFQLNIQINQKIANNAVMQYYNFSI